MKFLKSFLIILSLFLIVFSYTVFAKSEKVTVEFEENKISLTLPDNYEYYTNKDVDKNSNYFSSFPIDKNKAIENIGDGTYIDAFNEKAGREITFTITSDSFSQKIGNFTPMDENDKKSVIKTLKSTFKKNNQDSISEPKIIEIDGYDFMEFNCRIGNGDTGYSYKSIISIISGNCYEFMFFSNISVPNSEISEEFEDVIDSINLDMKGETGEIVKSVILSIISIIVIIVAAIVAILMVYSLVREVINKRNHSEKVRLKKRD